MKLSCEKEGAVVGEEFVVERGFAFVFVLFHFQRCWTWSMFQCFGRSQIRGGS